MSYRFSMGFAPASSFAKAMTIAAEAVDELKKKENAQKYINESQYYFPSNKILLSNSEKQSRSVQHLMHEATRHFLYNLFTVNFVYFYKQKLLGVCGECWPDDFKNYFRTFIDFQNSCDQDYERERWKGIRFFIDTYDQCANIPTNELLHLVEIDDEPLESMDPDAIDYYRKSLAYKMIFDELALDDWLYGRSNPRFVRFSLNAINTWEQSFELLGYVPRNNE